MSSLWTKFEQSKWNFWSYFSIKRRAITLEIWVTLVWPNLLGSFKSLAQYTHNSSLFIYSYDCIALIPQFLIQGNKQRKDRQELWVQGLKWLMDWRQSYSPSPCSNLFYLKRWGEKGNENVWKHLNKVNMLHVIMYKCSNMSKANVILHECFSYNL